MCENKNALIKTWNFGHLKKEKENVVDQLSLTSIYSY